MVERLEPYRILGLDNPTDNNPTDREEMKAAFRYLSKKYHPDRSNRPGTSARFVRVVKAYKFLNSADPKSRLIELPIRQTESGSEYDIFALGARALSASDPYERRRAVRRLGFSGKKASYVFLRRCLSDSEEIVVAAAIRAIADLSAYQGSGEIAALWARASDRIRRAILETAEATGEPLFNTALDLAQQESGLYAHRARRILSECMEMSV